MAGPDEQRIAADQLLDCFWRLDLELRLLEISPAAEAMFGIPPAALAGSPLADHMQADDFARIGDLLRHALASPDRTQGLLYRTRIKHADGHLVPIEVHSRVVLDSAGEPACIVGLARDISERERRQQAARRRDRARLTAQKHAAVMRLAASITPALTDLLTALEACPEAARKPELAPLMARAKENVDQLRALAGQQDLLPRDVDVDAFVRDAVESLRPELPADVSLAFKPGAPDAVCRLDPSQMLEVLRRLCANAAEAMAKGGLVRLATDVRAPEAEATNGTLPDATARPHVVMAVTDSGPGLDRDTREQLLDPFFSTRPQERPDLGFSLAHGIVRQHGGDLEVDGRLGHGTTVRVVLPATYATARRAEAAAAAGQRLLAVDDDPEMLRYVERVLRSGGFEVVTCADGVEALALLAGDTSFDGVVLDWALPGLDGRRVREQIIARHLRLPLLVISGHRREHYEALGSVDAATPWLLKPFTPTMLLETVRNLLARADAAHGS